MDRTQKSPGDRVRVAAMTGLLQSRSETSSGRLHGLGCATLMLAAFCLGPAEAWAATTVDLAIGTQTGANIQLNSTKTSYFNFGVTQLGEDQGLTLDSIRLYFQGQGPRNSPEDVVIELYSGFAGTGTVLSTATIVKTAMTNQYDPYDVLFGVNYLFTAGAYSIKVSTLSATTYNFKSGLLTVVDGTGAVLITSSNWVQDNNTTGTASTSLASTSNVLADYSLSTKTVAFGNYRVGSTLSQAIAVTNAGFTTSNNVTESLVITGTTNVANGTISVPGTPAWLNPGQSMNLTVGLDGTIAGPNSGTATPSFGSVKGDSASTTTTTTAVGSEIISISGTGYRQAVPGYSTSSPNIGNFRVGSTNVTGSITVSNTATSSDVYSEKLSVTSISNSGKATVGTMPALITAGSNAAVTVGISLISAGLNSGTARLGLSSDGTGTSGLSALTLSPQDVSITAYGYRTAAASFSATSVDLGKFHVGASNLSGSTTITNNVTNDAYSEKLEVVTSSATGGASHGTLPGLIAAGGNSSLSLALASVASVGANAGTVTVGLKSNGTGTSGLSAFDLGTQVINVSATGYSGQSTWNVSSSGSWRSFGNWDTSGGLPGIDGSLSVDDKATFGAGPSGATAISLDGESPVLTALTFSNANAAYTVRTGTGGSITLGTGSKSAALTNSAGSHAISAGVSLANDTVATIASGTVLALSGGLNGSGKLTKEGAGILSVTGTGNLAGDTTVSAGLLRVNGSIADSAIAVNSGGTLGGSGTVGDVLVASGGTIAPGNSPGILNAGDTTWSGGGNYNWQIYNVAGSAGVGGWDKVAITGNLDLTGLSAISRFNINLWSLSGLGPDVSGSAINFNSTSTYTWTIASVTGSILGFDAAFFSVNLAAANGTDGFTNDRSWVATNGNTYYGSIDLVQHGQNLDLVYSPGVPEPSTYGMMIGALSLAVAAIRRRGRKSGRKMSEVS